MYRVKCCRPHYRTFATLADAERERVFAAAACSCNAAHVVQYRASPADRWTDIPAPR